MGLRLTYHPNKRVVEARIKPVPHHMCQSKVSEGDSPVTYMPLTLSADLALDGR
jgi:hypothetical protein